MASALIVIQRPTKCFTSSISNTRGERRAPVTTGKEQRTLCLPHEEPVPAQLVDGGTKLKLAYQGLPGAYSEFAAKTASPGCIAVSCRTFPAVIAAVESGMAERAILPVETTTSWNTAGNYDLLLRHELRIVQEVSIFVRHCLLAIPGVREGELKRVISHPVALAHCSRLLTRLGVVPEAVEDTAGAVEMLLSRRLRDTAAIASPRAAALYGPLQVLSNGVQDNAWNVTRFVVLSKVQEQEHLPIHGRGRDHRPRLKTSIVIGHSRSDGRESLALLLRVLSAFASHGVNLVKVEVSRPGDSGKLAILDAHRKSLNGSLEVFPCVLYVDFEGAACDQKAMDAVGEICGYDPSIFMRVLGSYLADTNIYDLN